MLVWLSAPSLMFEATLQYRENFIVLMIPAMSWVICTVYPSLTFQVLTVKQKGFLIFKTPAMIWGVYKDDVVTFLVKSNAWTQEHIKT